MLPFCSEYQKCLLSYPTKRNVPMAIKIFFSHFKIQYTESAFRGNINKWTIWIFNAQNVSIFGQEWPLDHFRWKMYHSLTVTKWNSKYRERKKRRTKNSARQSDGIQKFVCCHCLSVFYLNPLYPLCFTVALICCLCVCESAFFFGLFVLNACASACHFMFYYR